MRSADMSWYRTLVLILIVIELKMSCTSVTFKTVLGLDELRSLDMCTARNQQRLGSVFGNFTRHHRKGHKKRPQTTIAPSVFQEYTIEEQITSTIATIPDANKIDKEINNLENNKHKKERHKRKYEDEHDIELNINTRQDRVKKMYRDNSGSNVNKVNAKGAKGSTFLTENCTTVVAQIGTTAVLHCEVNDITENTVTWIRKKDYSLLSVGLVTYSADSRFFSAHGRHVKDWALHIRFATPGDAGYYECQVPTHPPTSIFFKLILVAAYAEISGEPEKIIHEGSMLRLICQVKRSTEPPSYVFWYFEDRMINYDLNGVTVHNHRQNSELVIGTAEPRHSGNYTCVPANARAASVTVHVVQSEIPAAMQHGNSSSSSKLEFSCINTIFLIIFCKYMLRTVL